MAEDQELELSKRGFEKHTKNPFLPDTVQNTKGGVRKIAGSQKDRMMVVSESTGEMLAGGVGFWQFQEVDKTQFLKIYINGVKAITELSSAGAKVFEILYRELQEHKDKDQVYLSYKTIDQEITPISRDTFNRGMTNLIEKKFIAESQIQSLYFINPDFIFNGDRLSLVKTFIKVDRGELPQKK